MNYMAMIIIIISSITNWTGVNSEDTRTSRKIISYLVSYGFYKTRDPEVSVLTKEKDIQVALKKLQSFGGIPITGKLDAATEKLVETPRCGLPDMSDSTSSRRRRYSLHGTIWRKTKLTWKLINDNDDGLTREDVENTLTKAFGKWSAVTNLEFRKLERQNIENADITIKFAYGFHYDAYAFDGPGGIVAHGFYPLKNQGLSGDVHFDDAEWFTLGKSYGINLLWVAIHEIGHSIGLKHSSVYQALMYPRYIGNSDDDIMLNRDDIRGAQALYGIKSFSSTTSTTNIPILYSNFTHKPLNSTLTPPNTTLTVSGSTRRHTETNKKSTYTPTRTTKILASTINTTLTSKSEVPEQTVTKFPTNKISKKTTLTYESKIIPTPTQSLISSKTPTKFLTINITPTPRSEVPEQTAKNSPTNKISKITTLTYEQKIAPTPTQSLMLSQIPTKFLTKKMSNRTTASNPTINHNNATLKSASLHKFVYFILLIFILLF